ncbi:MAG: hypothetical protein KGJ57_19215 [Sphingomonadales bacterium]|nr:hypothetical protein [Sphingomonadales bacterium]MDE2171528.1 hypothetical protein [Sphingomonadales bacterium]
MRDVDPFCFFFAHASAIRGYGGQNRSPDPQYCFHTHYLDVRPGRARYELRLTGARSSQGQLTVRVHALKPSTGANATLVAGTRLELTLDRKDDLVVSVRFHALRDVAYAFYGFFSEYSDLTVDGLSVILDEPEGEEDDYFEPPVSAMLGHDGPSEVRPANALIHYDILEKSNPVSQDCTWDQLPELAGDPASSAPLETYLTQWREDVCLAAMTAYGAVISGLDGWVIGPVSQAMCDHFDNSPFTIRFIENQFGKVDRNEFADFLLWPEGPSEDIALDERWSQVKIWLEKLKFGGLAIVGLRYRHVDVLMSSSIAAEHNGLTRNEIGQWALRLIGSGFSVAPLAYADSPDLAVGEDQRAAFVLVVRRQ